jgi:hypothetical protein
MYLEKTCSGATLSTTTPKGLDLGSNPDHRYGKSATNRLSFGTVLKLKLNTELNVKESSSMCSSVI